MAKKLVLKFSDVLWMEEISKPESEPVEQGGKAVEISNASFQWGFTLQNELA